MNEEKKTPRTARAEPEVFADLQELCTLPGYIHAIAYFCWRDNIIRFSGDQVTEADVEYQYSHDKLIRTEISTLIGLMAKGEGDTALPDPHILQNYIDRSEALLYEMHMSLQKPWIAAFDAMARDPAASSRVDPFDTAEGLREPIFYSGESAYNFQYEELARLKYQADNAWIMSHAGFTIDDACLVARGLGELQMQKLIGLRETLLALPLDQWTFLSGFTFRLDELEVTTGLNWR